MEYNTIQITAALYNYAETW